MKQPKFRSFQCSLAESHRLCNPGLRDPSSPDAPHLFRASDDDTLSEQSVTIFSECIDVVVHWSGPTRKPLCKARPLQVPQRPPHRTPDLLHLRYDAVLEAERCERVPAYVRRRSACQSSDQPIFSSSENPSQVTKGGRGMLSKVSSGQYWSVPQASGLSGGWLQRIPFLKLEKFSFTHRQEGSSPPIVLHIDNMRGLFAVLQ